MPRPKGSTNNKPTRKHRVTVNLTEEEVERINQLGDGATLTERVRSLLVFRRTPLELAARMVEMGFIHGLPRKQNALVFQILDERRKSQRVAS